MELSSPARADFSRLAWGPGVAFFPGWFELFAAFSELIVRAASPYELELPAFDFLNWPTCIAYLCDEKPILPLIREARPQLSARPRAGGLAESSQRVYPPDR